VTGRDPPPPHARTRLGGGLGGLGGLLLLPQPPLRLRHPRLCVRACVCARACVRVCVCARASQSTTWNRCRRLSKSRVCTMITRRVYTMITRRVYTMITRRVYTMITRRVYTISHRACHVPSRSQ
jgi:hypothetical protein